MVNVIKSVTEKINDVKVIELQTIVKPKDKYSSDNNLQLLKNEQIEKEIIQKAEEKAKKLIKQAEEEIKIKKAQLLKEENSLHEKIEAALEEARVKGYQEGFEVGKKDGEQSVQHLIKQARELVDLSRAEYLEELSNAKPMIINLAIKTAEKIVGQTIKEDPESWNQLVKTAVKEVKEHENIKIFVHPSQYELTINHKKMLKTIIHDSTDLYIYPDDGLSENDCIIETSFGTIDASVDSQLAEIKKQLLEIVEEM